MQTHKSLVATQMVESGERKHKGASLRRSDEPVSMDSDKLSYVTNVGSSPNHPPEAVARRRGRFLKLQHDTRSRLGLVGRSSHRAPEDSEASSRWWRGATSYVKAATRKAPDIGSTPAGVLLCRLGSGRSSLVESISLQ